MRKTIIRQLSAILVILLAVQGCAMGSRPGPAVITGTIRLVGNEPFAHTVLIPGDNPDQTARDQVYLLLGPLTEKLKKYYQSRKITLEGSVCASPSPEFSKCFRPTGIRESGGGQE